MLHIHKLYKIVCSCFINKIYLFLQKLQARLFVRYVHLAGDNNETVSWLGDFKFPSWLDHQEQTFKGALHLEFCWVLLENYFVIAPQTCQLKLLCKLGRKMPLTIIVIWLETCEAWFHKVPTMYLVAAKFLVSHTA